MRHLILAFFAFVYLTSFTFAQKGGGGGSGGDGAASSNGRSGGGGGNPDTNSTEESSATTVYAAPNTGTYLNLQNILIGAGILALAQNRLGGN